MPAPIRPQTYMVRHVLAGELGVILSPTCLVCDGQVSQYACPCPVCERMFCDICWYRHPNSDDRCSDEAIVAATIFNQLARDLYWAASALRYMTSVGRLIGPAPPAP